MNEHPNNIQKVLELYRIYSDDKQRYDTIIWQFPTALVTVNILAINFFLDKPYLLLFISLANFVLLHSLFKHVYHQKAIIKALKTIGDKLRECNFGDIIPNFEIGNKIMKIKSADLLSYALLVMNLAFFILIILRLICN